MRVFVTASMFVLALSAMAQQDLFQWRIAVHAGVDHSLGDIESSYSDVAWDRSRVYGLELSKAFGYGISLGLDASSSRLSGYDVKTGRNDRALNFMSKLHTAQLDLTFRMDNGRLLKYDARFAPFLSIGIGAGRYNTFGDLYSASGSRYYYWGDGTIRDQAENGANAATSQVIEPDGDFETRLTDRATEDGKPKNQNFLFIPARIGLKWRICDRFAAEAFYGFNWTFTDFIDDVHGDYPARPQSDVLAYASNPTGRTGMRGDPNTDDKYHTVGLNLAYYFGRRSHSFRMNPVYVDDRSLPPPPPKAVVTPKPTPKPLAPPVQQNVVINVERIVVGRLSVDTLVVGHVQKKGTVTSDTTQRYTIRKIQLDSIMESDTLRLRSSMDSMAVDSSGILKGRLQDSLHIKKPDSVKSPLMLDTLRAMRNDTVPHLELDTMHLNKLDSLRSPLVPDTLRTLHPDTMKRVAPDSMSTGGAKSRMIPARPDPVPPAAPDTVYGLREGQLKQTTERVNVENTSPVPVPVIIRDTVRVPSKEVAQGRVDTVYIDRPVPSPRTERQAPVILQQAEPREQLVRTETKTVTVPVPVIVTKKETVKETVQDPALQDSLRKMQAENARLRNVAESLRTSATGATGTPLGTTPLPPGIRAGEYAGILTGLQAARIATLERYIEVMDNTANTAETDSLKRRIAEMDKEMAAMRAKRATASDSSASPAPEGMEETLLDTVTFSTGSSSVGNTARLQILKTGKRLAAAKVDRVLVTGQTDRSGNAAFNKRLSQDRADAVKRVLVEAGVPIGVITAKGLGEQLAQHAYDESERVVVVQAVMTKATMTK